MFSSLHGEKLLFWLSRNQTNAVSYPDQDLLKKYETDIKEEFHTSMANDFGTPAALRDILAHFKKAAELAGQLSAQLTALPLKDELLS